MDKLNNSLAAEEKMTAKKESAYYRSVNKKPFDYTKMATPIGEDPVPTTTYPVNDGTSFLVVNNE